MAYTPLVNPVVGLVGWRGMVGSVLMQRMQDENDFTYIEPIFFSTSNAGGGVPLINGQRVSKTETRLQDANDVKALARCDVILTCQGGDYTKAIYPQLRAAGWQGHWIDAASALRMENDAVIVLDPINRPVINQALGRRWQKLDRWQLHCELNDACHGRSPEKRHGRVDQRDDLPSSLWSWGR